MSKASEWVKNKEKIEALKENLPPRIALVSSWWSWKQYTFSVSEKGNLTICKAGELNTVNATEAIRLADWIYDTFGEDDDKA